MMRKKSIIYLFILFVFAALQGAVFIQADAKSDVHTLIDSTHTWVESETVLVSYQDFYKTYVDEQELAKNGRQLEAAFGFPAAGSLLHSPEKRPVYRTVVNRKGILISLNLTAIEEHNTQYLVITLESTETEPDSELFDKRAWLEQQKSIEKKLRAMGISDEGQTTIEGVLPASFQHHPAAWQSSLIDALELNELESYQDHRTLSVSYYSPQLSNHIISGTKKMNLQIALSHDSHENQWRVTIGSPIITVEY
jgi:hypothetical protein